MADGLQLIESYYSGMFILSEFNDEINFRNRQRQFGLFSLFGSLGLTVISFYVYQKSKEKYCKLISFIISLTTFCVLGLMFNSLPFMKNHIDLSIKLGKKYSKIFNTDLYTKLHQKLFLV